MGDERDFVRRHRRQLVWILIMENYRLPNKLPDEKILKILRRDFFIIFKKVIFFILLSVLPLAVFYLLSGVFPNLLLGQISYPVIILGASAYYLFVWLFFFFNYIDYYLDITIITNERIIDVNQQGFFARTISELRLHQVQDVTSISHGALATIFKFGDIDVQTAGAKDRFLFEEISNPDTVRDFIIKLVEENKIKHKDEL